jgi:hypothetical protein
MSYPIMSFNQRFASGTFALAFTFLAFSGITAATLSPRDGATLRNNAPMLAWQPQKADAVEVWMDGARLAELSGDAANYAPFPLGYGCHEWKVAFVKGGVRTETDAGHFTIADKPLCNLPDGAVLLREGWHMQSAFIAGADGAKISGESCDVSGWYTATLPTTALSTLVRAGVYPDPYIGFNNTLIPDSSDAFNRENDLLKRSHIPGRNPWAAPYWFRRTFSVPESYAGKRVWLAINEINYRADVWLNGSKIADGGDVAGMERSFRFDVTNALKAGGNTLAIAVHPVDIPAKPEPCPVMPLAEPGVNMGGDGTIALNYTKFDTIGWDWQPEVRDRDMGITEDVYLCATDEVEIANLYVATDLPLPDTSSADLYVSFDLVNRGKSGETGRLAATVTTPDGKSVAFEKTYCAKAGETVRVKWSPANVAALKIANPALWWPCDMGPQNLYTLSVERVAGGERSVAKTTFGIREIETCMVGTALEFMINGRKEYVRGGCWVPDMCLTWTAGRYEDEVRLARQSGLNFLRVWGPSGVPPEAFYEAADRLGILVQQDFLNDYWGMLQNNPKLVPPESIFADASAQIVRKTRNHPSVIVWCGGNEGLNQREALLTGKILPENDPLGKRHFLRASDNYGLTGHGPYWNLTPKEYFASDRMTGFNGEIGPSGVPEVESLMKFLTPPENWAEGRFPLDGCWAYHDATCRNWPGEMRKFTYYDDILRRFYGAPKASGFEGIGQYAAKAQLVNYEAYRSVMEALNRKLWRDVTGFALWKSNSSWPSVVWQLNDWYMQPNAGFYAVRKACEPVHVQLNRDKNTLTVVNRRETELKDATIRAEVFDLAMNRVFEKSAPVDLSALGVSETAWSVPEADAMTFLRLRLIAADGATLSDGFYWLSAKDDFRALNDMPRPETEVATSIEKLGGETRVRVTISNCGKSPAFMLRAKLVDSATGLEVLPTYWDDNYVCVMPGESRVLTAEVDTALMPQVPQVEVQGVLNR